MGPPKTASMAELKEAASVGGLFHIRPILAMSPMAHSRHGAMSDLGPQKRVKADVTEGTVIIATTLEVGRGRVGHCEFHPPRTGKRKRREFSPLSSTAWMPKSRSPARGAIREPVALICRARSA